jgi:hypothetical protein
MHAFTAKVVKNPDKARKLLEDIGAVVARDSEDAQPAG